MLFFFWLMISSIIMILAFHGPLIERKQEQLGEGTGVAALEEENKRLRQELKEAYKRGAYR